MNNYRSADIEGALTAMGTLMAKVKGLKVKFHDGAACDADIFTNTIRVPRVVFASQADLLSSADLQKLKDQFKDVLDFDDAIMLLRSNFYHELGHIMKTKLTKAEWPSGALHKCWNAVEDRWMEREMCRVAPGIEQAIRWAGDYYNKKVAAQINGGHDAPLWEALVAMGFLSDGIHPAWNLTEKAEAYFDAGYDIFIEWRHCKSSKDCLEVAKKLHDVLREVHEEYENERKQEESGQDDGQGGDGDSQDQDSQDSDNGQQDAEDQKEGKGGTEGDESEDDAPSGNGGSGDFDDDDEESEKSGSGGSDDTDDDTEEDEGDDAAGGSGDEDESEKSDETDSDEGDSEDETDSDEGDSEDETDSDEGDDAEGDDTDDDAGDSASSGSGEKASDNDEEEADGQESKDFDSDDSDYSPGDDGSEGDDDPDVAFEMEADGPDLNDFIAEDLGEVFGGIDTSDIYLSRTDNDEHLFPEMKGDKERFKTRRAECGASVMALSCALEQSLRSITKSRKDSHRRRGKIDPRRLTAITKSLSKEVFYQTRNGFALDVAVEIVIDESYSMTNYEQVKTLAIAMGEALSKIGVPFEITGTTTKYAGGSAPRLDGFTRTNPIVYKHYKLFSEPWAAVRHRTVNISRHVHNVDGETVEFAASRLMDRREKRKIIFSICDGEPCAGHYNDSVMADNLVKVCEETRKRGIEVYGFGIGTYGPQAYYGKDWFVHLKNSEEMGPEFIRRFASIITGGRIKVGR
jgi:cobalamin biosynthesis protein CobT